MEEKHWRPRSLVGPVILILLGLTFLLNNLGMLQWNMWEMMWKLWPLWLIAVGLDLMIGRRFRWGSIVVLAVVLCVAGAAITWQGVTGAPYTVGEQLSGDKVAQPVDNARTADVSIKSSVGEFRIAAGSDSMLVDGTVQKLSSEEILRNVGGSGDRVTYSLRSNFRVGMPNFGPRDGGVWDLRLSPKVPMDLTLGTGIGKSTIDLSALMLTSLKVDTGIGETSVTLPAQGKFDARVNAGIGKVTIVIPHGMAAQVKANTGIGNVRFLGEAVAENHTYTTPDFGTAPNQITLRVDGGIGEVVVEQR